MANKLPRTLSSLWDDPDSRRRYNLRSFITDWVNSHDRDWEQSEIHWLCYVREFVHFRDLESFRGAKLLRKAESAAQRLLASRLGLGLGCKYCVTMESPSKEEGS